MGGSIRVLSQEGVGSEFIVTLQLRLCGEKRISSQTASIERTPRRQDFSGCRILLAEDNELNQEIATEILKDAGFLVDAVKDGDEAVSRIKANPEAYDLILMDIQMPRMNGYEATRHIRTMAHPMASAIPILAMTANAFEEDRQAALDAGMNGHIVKPIRIADLMETLSNTLNQGRKDNTE